MFLLKSIRAEMLSSDRLFFSELSTAQKRISALCHRKESLIILYTMQSYMSYVLFVMRVLHPRAASCVDMQWLSKLHVHVHVNYMYAAASKLWAK